MPMVLLKSGDGWMRRGFPFVLGGLFLLTLFLVFRFILVHKVPDNVLVGSGIVEGDEVELASKVPGRVERLYVKEGDRVEKGNVIARLDSEDIKARVEAAQARVRQLRRELKRAKVAFELTKDLVDKGIKEARAGVEVAKARLDGAKARWKKWEKDWRRFTLLKKREVIAQKRLDEVEAAFKEAKSAMEASAQDLIRAKTVLETALAKKREVVLKEKDVEVLEAAVATAEANLKETGAYLKDTVIRSPSKGVVVEKLVEEGEVVTAGTPLVVITDLDSLYLKIYVPETLVGLVSIGQKARLYVDSYPERPFNAEVCYVAHKSEFTPKEVQTHRERVQYTFAVKLCILENKGYKLKPGMPGDGVLKLTPGPWWNPIKERKEE
jgi:HlyD family secretion protein